MTRRVLPVLVGALLAPGVARAQTFELFGPDRGRDRFESPQHFAFEFRAGPWYPLIDNEFVARGRPERPFHAILGDDDRLLVGAELDWQILRVNPVGSLGIGVGLGYTSATAVAPVTRSDPNDLRQQPTGGQETSLNVLPAYAVAIVRLDGLARRTFIPVVPYAKAGLAYSLWWVTTGDNLARRNASSPGPVPDAATDLNAAAFGGTLGLHLAAGVMLRLDNFEPQAQRSWDTEMGVNHSYLFFEYTRANTDLLGSRPQLQVGSNTWTAGIALEF